jgi:hypothetical protein
MPGTVTLVLACLVALALALLAWCALSAHRAGREAFVAGPAQARRAVELLAQGAPYSDFKLLLQEGADPVAFADLRQLSREGRLTPAEVEKVLSGAAAEADTGAA